MPGEKFPGPMPDLEQMLFFARSPNGWSQVGQPLLLEDFSLSVQANPIATRSHLSLTVKNPQENQVEAVMQMPIPPGAAVTRTVLHVGDRLMDGVFVTRQRAEMVYGAITSKRRDPALLTWSGPEWIHLRVFPVDGHNTRTVELEWIEPTATSDDGAWYRLPVIANRGQNPMRPTSITVNGSTIPTQGQPWLHISLEKPQSKVAQSPGNPHRYFFSPSGGAHRPASPSLLFLADTSSTMTATDRIKQHKAITLLLDSLTQEARITLLAVDWTIKEITNQETPDGVRAKLNELDEVPSAGALDLEKVLLAASTRANLIHANRIVFFGRGRDGFQGDSMAAPLGRLFASGQTLVAVGISDHSPLHSIVQTGGKALSWNETVHDSVPILSLLERTPPSLNLADAETSLPLETVTGQTRWLTRFLGPAPEGIGTADAHDLETLWARARIPCTSSRLRCDEGIRYQVLTPFTSILVLESQADYERWNIALPNSADRKLGQENTATEAGANNEHSIGDFPTGGLSGQRGSFPQLIPSHPRVNGSLDKETIRRIIRRHTHEVMDCYEDQLSRTPDFEGSVSVLFTIANSGKVVLSRVESSTINNRWVEDCIVVTVRNWKFPKSFDGRESTVGYSFILSPGRWDRNNDFFETGIGRNFEQQWENASTSLSGKNICSERSNKMAALAQTLRMTRVAASTWQVVRRRLVVHSPVKAFLLAADILRQDGNFEDAQRLLSEAIPLKPDAVANEFGRLGNMVDMDRIAQISLRRNRCEPLKVRSLLPNPAP